ncbi:MAG: WecB/TagA/CpsF family glycosyltransferase [Patescibacteria group bacterium]|nr:WecB/TagA/CpsF family glycosyltransferase [Patescibacteria group bacterium]
MKINILGINLDNLERDALISKTESFLTSTGFHYIVTPNPEMIVDAQNDTEFRDILNRADIAVSDGFGIIMAATILGLGKINRVSGADLVWDILELAKKRNQPVFLLGGLPGIAKRTAEIIKDTFPGINICGAESGGRLAKFAGEWEIETGLIEKIASANPSILIIGRGHPWQEKFINDFKARLPSVKLAIGVGGTFDFICGRIRRAPKIMRKTGLEWLWRLAQEPMIRLPRIYKAIIIFTYLVIKTRLCFSRKK